MAGFILRGLVAALGLWAATEVFEGSIVIDSALDARSSRACC